MRHGKKINHLGRTDSHRRAMLANMASSLIKHKRITTTLAKAKALRTYVEPLITKSKNDTTHSRRTVFSYLKDKETITILFREVAEKVATRPGGYTRILKLENRFGDNAEMALIELVDYNEIYAPDSGAAEKKSTRRRGSKAKKDSVQVVAPVAEKQAPESVVAQEEAAVESEPVAETTAAEAEEVQVEEPVAEVSAEEAASSDEPAAADEDEKKETEG
ncbi:MAG TPA: 50S ribosomal protein L17 [Sphingobacteriaceae bacterium]|nr:50S ribosomal protein L17 [Sphingobacteriaceae bacterium]